ncbi:MAG: restriction endonuclease subunit S [Saccharofermentanales bacterium]|jgi:type I restriction enzyme M protein
MNKEQEKRIMEFWDTMRGAVAPKDYITAAVLVSEVKNRAVYMKTKETSDAVYSILLEVADELRIKNPFYDRERFFFIYQESKQLQKMDWEGAIDKMARYLRMPVLPSAIIKAYEERFSKKPDTVLIAEAEKFVPNLLRIVNENINSEFVLTTQNAIYAKALEYVFSDYNNVEILLTSIYRYEFVNKRFDLIFSCPNFGGRTLAEDETFMCREFDLVALENLSLHLNSGGRLVITLPGRITFASGKVNSLRQFIQTSYTIREIAELPEASLEYTDIKVYLLEIENIRPGDDDIIIRRYSAGERKTRRSVVTFLEVTDDTFVMLSELEEQGNWSIDRIFAQQDEEYLNFQKSSIRKELIGNVAQVFRGKAVNKKDPAGNIGVVNISNIGDYEIDYENLDYLQEEERKVTNYLLQEGDVLLPARGTAIRTAVFHEQNYPCIASSNVIVIRPDAENLDGYYLKIFLDSPIGNKLISGVQQGMTVMNIRYKDLNTLEVPLPNIDEQQEVVREYLGELERYKRAVAAAEQRWSGVLKKLQTF